MDASIIKMMAETTARVVKDHLKGIKDRVKAIETQGRTINDNFGDIDKRLSAIEDMLTDPGRRS